MKCQATRSRSQNEKIARSLLADKVEAQEKGDQSRVAIKAEAARKKKASKSKKTRRKYRGLEEKESQNGAEHTGGENELSARGTKDTDPQERTVNDVPPATESTR